MKKSILFSLLLVSQIAQADLWMYPPNDYNINGRNDASLRYDILGDQAQLSIKVEGRVAKKLMELSQEEGAFSDYQCDANLGYCSKAISHELMIQDYVGDNIGFAEDNTHLSLYKDALVLLIFGS